MTVPVSQINFVLDTRSMAWVSRETGIPSSTVSYVVAGTRRLPSKYVDEVRRLYRREAYRRIRLAGASVSQASRFKWYSPQKVREVINLINTKVIDMAKGHATKWHKPVYKNGVQVYGEERLRRIEEMLREALKKTRASYEDVQRY